jgi:hypothetical protein
VNAHPGDPNELALPDTPQSAGRLYATVRLR